MSAYDDWKTTNPAEESVCEDCGVDTEWEDHRDDCSEAGHEPNYEAMLEPEEEDPKR